VSYGEWAGISEELSQTNGFKDGDEIEIDMNSMSITLPVRIIPALKRNIIMIHREFCGEYKINKFNEYGDILSIHRVKNLKKTGKRVSLPILSGALFQDGRGITHEYESQKHSEKNVPRTLYPEPHHKEYRWAMVIDLELCTGCSACVASCYIENNIPVVGKKLHLEGRELSWIRLEPYFDNKERPVIVPMLCQQCSYAPCESVCPVYATYHNPEGINAQIYNRCVGTRYCSNNCPYKVRRFNWFNFRQDGIMSLRYNPDVSVRPRGVMEKCTFCVQRIRRAHDVAKDKGISLKDGDIVPACGQTCPSNAIIFGNILDKDSMVYKLASSERAYRIFEHLGVEPAVYYLKKRTGKE
jgi:molybdopterin-containing oxidoreductase family iron-sulfur binding subunit